MEKDATLKLTLDTKEFLAEAKRVGPELEKALNIKGELPGVTDLQEKLHKIREDVQSIKTGNMKGAFNAQNLEKYNQELNKTVTTINGQDKSVLQLAEDLEATQKKLADLGRKDGQDNEAFKKSLIGKIGAASRNGGNAEGAKANLQTAKDLIAQETVLNTELEKHRGTVERIHSKLEEVHSVNEKYGEDVTAINAEYDKVAGTIQTGTTAVKDQADAENEVKTATNEVNQTEKDATKQTEAHTQAIKDQAKAEEEAKESKKTVMSAQDLSTSASYKDLIQTIISYKQEMAKLEGVNTEAANSQRAVYQSVIDTAKGLLEEKSAVDASTMSSADLTRQKGELIEVLKYFSKEVLASTNDLDGYYDHLLEREVEVKQAWSDRMKELSGVGETPQSGTDLFSGDTGAIINSIAGGLDSVGSAFNDAGNYAINFADILNIVRVCMGDVSAVAPLITSAFNKISNAIKTTIDNIRKLISDMVKFSTTVANKFFSVIKNGLSGLSKAGSSGDNPFDPKNLKRALQLLTKYVFGFRSFFFLYRRLRKLVGEGLENLVQFESETNKTNAAITELRTSLLYIKNAWAAAFAPIINVVQPLLTSLMDMIADVGNAIARFVGALTGQEVVLNAVRVSAGDYAKSLDNAGGSASKAADKTKKLTDRLAAFDDLNVLGKDNDPDGTGSGGGGGGANSLEPDPSQMFTYVAAVSKFADMIKSAWSHADFTEVGELIRQKLIEAITKPFGRSWDEIKDIAYNAGKSIITFFNGVFADPSIWNRIGITIAEGLNTVGRFVAGLLENNKIDFGFNFAELIVSFFRTFNVDEFVKNIEGIADLISKNINSFFKKIFSSRNQENSLFSAIEQMSAGLTRAFINLIMGLDWATIAKTALLIGKAILTGISNAFEESDNPLLQRLGKLVGDAIPVLLYAVKELSPVVGELIGLFADIGLDLLEEAVRILPIVVKIVKEFTTKWLPQIVAWLRQAWPIIKLIIEEGLVIILHLLEDFDFDDFVTTLLNVAQVLGTILGVFLLLAAPLIGIPILVSNAMLALFRIIDAFDAREWIEAGRNLIAGLLEGIVGALSDIYNWFKTNVFEPITSKFKTLFGIESPSTVFEEYGVFIMQGLYNGIDGMVDDILQLFDDFKTSVGLKWDEIKSTLDDKTQRITQSVSEKFGGLKSTIGQVIDDIKQSSNEKWEAFKQGIVDVFNAISTAIKGPINTTLGIIESFINKVIKGINDLFKNFEGIEELAKEVGLDVSVTKIPTITIPKLAQGAVIPPNKEFMAVLGDQSHGTNIEAPLDTIKQAVAEVLANNGNAEVIQLLQELITVVESKNLTIGDKEIGKANARYNSQQRMIRGTSF